MYYSKARQKEILNSPEETAMFIDTIDLNVTARATGFKTNVELKEEFAKYTTEEQVIKYIDPFMRGTYADLSYPYRREFLRVIFEIFKKDGIILALREIAPHRDTYIVYDRDDKHKKLKTGIKKVPTQFHSDMLNYGGSFYSNIIHENKFIEYMNQTYKCKFDTLDTKAKYEYLAEHVLLGAKTSANHVRQTLAGNLHSVQFDYYVFFRFVDLLIDIYTQEWLQRNVIDEAKDRGVISKEKEIHNSRIANIARFS